MRWRALVSLPLGSVAAAILARSPWLPADAVALLSWGIAAWITSAIVKLRSPGHGPASRVGTPARAP